MTLQEQRDVIQAAIEGKPIEWRPIRDVSNPVWALLDNHVDPVFNFFGYEYRVKPQPREWWLILDRRGFWVAHQCITAGIEDQIHVREVLDE